MESIDPKSRYKIEEQYHDTKAQEEVNDFYQYGPLQLADDFLWKSLGDLKGKKVLEIGCGVGTATLRFAEAGATITAIDISGGMVELTKKRIKEHGYADKVQAVHMKGEDINFENDSFDVIYGHSVLHHLDLKIFGSNCSRVLRKNGVACFLEPLGYNPIINLFRILTPNRRTPTEQPLKIQQLLEMKKNFSQYEHREYFLLSLVAFFWYYGLRSRRLFRSTLMLLNKVDHLLFKLMPPLRRLTWVTVVRFTK